MLLFKQKTAYEVRISDWSSDVCSSDLIAGGIDVVYPPEHKELQGRIAAEGLLIAEQPPGVEPQARHFPRRNRIIAGLSLGVVVVEAAPKSGSLITARLALEQGRDVMAVPGRDRKSTRLNSSH